MSNLLTRSQVDGLRLAMRTEMQRHLPKWRSLSEYIAPQRLKEQGNRQKVDGRRKDQHIINNQAGRSLRTFVSGMMNGATPRNRPWFNVVSSSPSVADTSNTKKYYSETESVLNRHFQVSNLYRVLPLAYKDVGVFSNAAFAMLPHARYGFYFYPFAMGTCAWACDPEGKTNQFTRDFTLSVRQLVETYGSLDSGGKIVWNNIPQSIKTKWDQARYLEEILLTQVIVPNPTYNPSVKSLKPQDKRFQSYTYIVGGNVSGVPNQSPSGFRNEGQGGVAGNEPGQYLKVGGYSYFPVITPRWEVEPEGYYGVDGPGEIALGDIITLQLQEQYRHEAIEKLVRPPMVGHASLRRHASSILAGGITYVDDRGMQQGFKPAFTLNPQLSELIGAKEEIQSYIKTSFYEDLFLQLSSQQTISHVTAAQINQQTAETMAAMAPVLGQWDHDTSGPIIENAQIILEELGRMPVKPRELEGVSVVPEYISVLAQASKASLIVTQEKFIDFTSRTADALGDPTLLKLVNGEKQVRAYAENSGLDPNLILDEKEYKKIQGAAAQAQAQVVQNQQANDEANRAKIMSETKTGNGSMLDQVIA